MAENQLVVPPGYVQTGEKQWSPEMTSYMFQQSFPTSKGSKENLLKHQDASVGTMQCTVQCGNNAGWWPALGGELRFDICTSPLQSYFTLQLCLHPKPPPGVSMEPYVRDRIVVHFMTYDETTPDRYASRVVYPYTSHNGNTPPQGPKDFSPQLYEVRYTTADKLDAPPDRRLRFPDLPLDKHTVFIWRSEQAVKMNWDIPVPQRMEQSVKAFKGVMHELLVNGQRMHVLFQSSRAHALHKSWWPWFAAIPSPVPETFSPWMNTLKEPGDVFKVRGTGDFELIKDYTNKALAKRRSGWELIDEKTNKPKEDVTVPLDPSTIEIGKFDPVLQFKGSREYLAHIVGSHLYEDLHLKSSIHRWFNGDHRCDYYPILEGGTTKKILFLLFINPSKGKAINPADHQDIPEPGERVSVTVKLVQNAAPKEYHGTVIRIPNEHLKSGRNVAVLTVPPPFETGLVVAPGRIKGEFYFGHHGTSSTPLRNNIVRLMTDQIRHPAAQFYKSLFLSQDLYHSWAASQTTSTDLPANWRTKVNEACSTRKLNPEQTKAVNEFFRRKFSLAQGPPGTGKSFLVNTTLIISHNLKSKVWIVTDSNPAIDLLAEKLHDCFDELNGFLRIRSSYQETFTRKTNRRCESISSAPRTPAPGSPAGINVGSPTRSSVQASPAGPPAGFPAGLAAPSPRNRALSMSSLSGALPSIFDSTHKVIAEHVQAMGDLEKILSLEELINRRLDDREANEMGTLYWPKERSDLKTLDTAYKALHGIKLEARTLEAFAKQEHSMEHNFNTALLKVQQKYVKHYALFIFSTSAASSGPYLRHFKPASLIMDEASQSSEARAVDPIVSALEGGNLQRVLLIGDHKLLPPIMVASVNPFSQTTDISLFERLINAGFPFTQLTTQYRMHPYISAVCKEVFYSNTMIDGPNTQDPTREGVLQFQKFVKNYALGVGKGAGYQARNAIIIEPTRDLTNPGYDMWGSAQPVGSTFRINFGTARMVYQLANLLVRLGDFKPSQIMVICFYGQQVSIIKALMQGDRMFDGVTVSTVDGAQGSERDVVIVDLVRMGETPGANDGMGFLNSEKKRFNVAMTRARIGRIVIAHPKMLGANNKQDNSWVTLFRHAHRHATILSGDLLNRFPYKDGWAHMKARFDDVRATFGANTAPPVGNTPVRLAGHVNGILSVSAKTVVSEHATSERAAIAEFKRVTGMDNDIVVRAYLREHNWDPVLAINKWDEDMGVDTDIENLY